MIKQVVQPVYWQEASSQTVSVTTMVSTTAMEAMEAMEALTALRQPYTTDLVLTPVAVVLVQNTLVETLLVVETLVAAETLEALTSKETTLENVPR